MNRLAILGGFVAACLCLGWHTYCERELLYSAWVSFCVMMVVALVLRQAMAAVSRVMIDYLKHKADQLESFENEDTN